MNKHRDIDFFNSPAAAREWQAQEAAAQAARDGRAPADAREASYRHVHAALRADDAIGLPADFAERLAASAGPVPTAITAPETGLEKQLTRLLLAALVIAGLAFAMFEGGSWFQADPAAWSVAGNPWVLALLACLGASQGAELLRRRMG
ncbi:hypothetical protein [Dyella sp.]|jgi:hypothetical protein|uniref:hypothetical protein n=1 Tax=Dyella sp. TaxID=1869338 RepID=UPI002D769C41|nr:hypothetical protein [Dyella sp.]HET6433786.1 hypothetical protein [Dyella sp.]